MHQGQELFGDRWFDGDCAVLLSESVGFAFLQRSSISYRLSRVLMRGNEVLKSLIEGGKEAEKQLQLDKYEQDHDGVRFEEGNQIKARFPPDEAEVEHGTKGVVQSIDFPHYTVKFESMETSIKVHRDWLGDDVKDWAKDVKTKMEGMLDISMAAATQLVMRFGSSVILMNCVQLSFQVDAYLIQARFMPKDHWAEFKQVGAILISIATTSIALTTIMNLRRIVATVVGLMQTYGFDTVNSRLQSANGNTLAKLRNKSDMVDLAALLIGCTLSYNFIKLCGRWYCEDGIVAQFQCIDVDWET